MDKAHRPRDCEVPGICGTSSVGMAATRLIEATVPSLIAVYQFGSTAREQERPDSDVDLAVLSAAPVCPSVRFALQEQLARILHAEVDLVDLRSVPTVMRMQILSTGRVLADLDHSARESFEMYVYSDYARLNEERAPILRRIREEGSVYGR